MTNITTDQDQTPAAESQSSEPETKSKKASKGMKSRKRAKVAKKGTPAKKAASKPTPEKAPEQSNKKAEMIAMMKRSKGATLDEIMQARMVKKRIGPIRSGVMYGLNEE